MKTLILILIVGLFVSCTKQEFIKVEYKVDCIGGSTEISFDGENFKPIEGFDSAFIMPVHSERINYLGFRIKHLTHDGESSVNVKILVNELVELEREVLHKGCKNGDYIFSVRY